MAAFDLFHTVIRQLSETERTAYLELIEQTQTDLLAARSEEARLRITQGFVADLHLFRTQGTRRPARMTSAR